MKIPAIKQLVEQYNIDQLNEAEEALLEEQQPSVEVPGDDEGEQLTHVIAAKWVINEMEENGTDFKKAVRAYSQKVRDSIRS